MTVRFEYERHTKNFVRFKEDIEGKKKIGTLYVDQEELRDIGWCKGDPVSIELKVER